MASIAVGQALKWCRAVMSTPGCEDVADQPEGYPLSEGKPGGRREPSGHEISGSRKDCRMAICMMASSSQDCAKHRTIRNDPTSSEGPELSGGRRVAGSASSC